MRLYVDIFYYDLVSVNQSISMRLKLIGIRISPLPCAQTFGFTSNLVIFFSYFCNRS